MENTQNKNLETLSQEVYEKIADTISVYNSALLQVQTVLNNSNGVETMLSHTTEKLDIDKAKVMSQLHQNQLNALQIMLSTNAQQLGEQVRIVFAKVQDAQQKEANMMNQLQLKELEVKNKTNEINALKQKLEALEPKEEENKTQA